MKDSIYNEKRGFSQIQTLFIRSLTIDWSKLHDSYVRRISALADLQELSFHKRITFFVGENGSGKSTLLEAIAIAAGFNPEGGTINYNFSTYNDYSDLGEAMKLVRGFLKPQWGYFLRAESFYNVASVALTEYNIGHEMPDYHAQSHGESFLSFIQEAQKPGLYLLDEPEAALSPQRQLTLLIYLVKMAEKGSQFIIISHSPILLGTPGSEILSFDDGPIHPISYEETESYKITRTFVENKDYFLSRLLSEDASDDDD